MKIFLVLFFFGVYILNVNGQTPSPTPIPVDRNTPVTTDAGFIADANAAFTELKAAKEALEKYRNERGRTEAERAAADAEIKGLNALIDIFKQGYAQYGLMVTALQKIIEFQWAMIDRFKDMLNKPKNWFQKAMEKVLKVVEIAIAVLIGHGLASYVRDNRPFTTRTDRKAVLYRSPFPEAYG